MRQPVVGPRKDQPDIDRCAGMHERLGNGRGCMAAVRGQQSRGCGSERQVVPRLSWLKSGEALHGNGLDRIDMIWSLLS